MSDKSFGDHINRNVVKNSLLSSAVIGLSLEDLTHKAVLLPATPSQGQVTCLDQAQGSQSRTLANADHDKPSLPSGDAYSNIPLSNTPLNAPSHPPNRLDTENYEKNRNITTETKSKASLKSTKCNEDDFDVNEYIARLQGTRYVSAPPHSIMKEEQNTNLETEESLEEINLNEAEPVQQSLTADIAQNFSQLPTVLPHVASAVFSSFSNMLSMRSRDQTPDDRTGYQETIEKAGVPLMVVDDAPKDFGVPPKEPPVIGASSYRITSKKKYAQIPGLSHVGAPQNVYHNPNIPFTTEIQNIPSYMTPGDIKNANEPHNTADNHILQYSNSTVKQFSAFAPEDNNAFKSNEAAIEIANVTKAQFTVNTVVNPDRIADRTTSAHNAAEYANIQQFPVNENQSNAANEKENLFTPIDKDITTPRLPIIPPPPMFSNPRTNQTLEKSVLPPSVARRISANQPLIKPQAIGTTLPDNFFVPSVPEPVDPQPGLSQSITPNPAIKPYLHQMAPPVPISQSSSVPLFKSSETSSSGALRPPYSTPAGSTQASIGPFFSSAPEIPSTGAIFTPSNTEISQAIGVGPVSPLSETKPSTSIVPEPPSIETEYPNAPRDIPVSGLPPSAPFVQMFTPSAQIPPAFINQQALQATHLQMPPNLPPEAKPLVEPPKATGLNFRMTKKRPQYYSGPIEGVGDISNNVKPIIPPVVPPVPTSIPNAYPATFFNPEQQPQPIEHYNAPNEAAFDINKPVEPTYVTFETTQHKPLDVNANQGYTQYNTAFDLSRATDSYEPPKEQKGFGIIGSLKSKLSSIDINKIQSTVTTFFDPAYNAKGEPSLETTPYAQKQYDQYSHSNFEITVPNAEQNYSQIGQGYSYDENNQYYQGRNAYNYQNEQHNVSSYFTEPSYPSQVYTLNTNTQEDSRAPCQTTISQNVESINRNEDEKKEVTFFNAVTIQEHKPKAENDVNYPQNIEMPIEKTSTDTVAHYISPNVGTHGAVGDIKASVNHPIGIVQSYKDFTDPVQQAANFFDSHLIADNVKTYDDSLNVTKDAQIDLEHKMHFNAPLPPAVSFFDSPVTTVQELKKKTEGLTNEMEKLALAEEIAIASSPFPAIKFQIGANTESKVIETCVLKTVGQKDIPAIALDKNVQNFHINKKVEVTPDKKGISLVDSLSADTTPIVAVSSEPLFGLSALITDEIQVIANVKNDENICFYEATKEIKPLLEQKAFSYFENNLSENKQAPIKPTTGLNITDIKNVLLIEPPLDNLGTILQRTASSSLLKDLPETEDKSIPNLCEDNRPWNRDEAVITSKDNVSLLFDRKASGFFDHLTTPENPVEGAKIKDTDATEQESDFNICETCREVNTPKENNENVTNQLIENINSSIQLENPVEALLKESVCSADDKTFENKQRDDINRITEDTIETLQVQSATDLLDNTSSTNNSYGWNTEQLAYASIAAIDQDFVTNTGVYPKYNTPINPEYTFKIDPTSIGFFENNSLFFDNVPKNASDEIKAELKTHEDIVPPLQMSIPSAPPAEEIDTKSDETGGLDVHSIEQDANNDFPLEEEFIIEPSETDDDKIEFRERKRSSEDFTHDTFADRIEKFKSKASVELATSIDNVHQKSTEMVTPPKSMASYFDTGNYAVETHYRNSLTSPTNNTFKEPTDALQEHTNEYVFNDNVPTFDKGIDSYEPEEVFRLPPGFEDELRRKFLEQSNANSELFIPETSTQTQTTNTTTFNVSGYAISDLNVDKRIQPLETKHTDGIPKEEYANDTLFKLNKMQNETIPTDNYNNTTPLTNAFLSTNLIIKDRTQAVAETAKVPESKPNVLEDPINFFTNQSEGPVADPPESFNRLASYFSMPPAQPDRSKSFFELSQSQNHYRHAANPNERILQLNSKANAAINNLMRDLTSTQNINFDNVVVRTVNYFSVECDNIGTKKLDHRNAAAINDVKNIKENNSDSVKSNGKIHDNVDSTIIQSNADDIDINKIDDIKIINACKYCCNIKLEDAKDYKVRTAVDSDNRREGEGSMSEKDSSSRKKSVSIDFGNLPMDEEAQDGVTLVQENRSSSEYSPVRHHWFYRVDVDDKSVWRGFSMTDSNALEQKYLSPDLSEDTLVATDGGRFDVNVIGRLRFAVYWKEKPTNVRRCSWFYKGTTDARYVPYTEAVADKLEEEYRHGVTTGEWHRRLVLPNSELVVMHGPAVMVHFLHGGSSDTFSSPPFLFGKHVYRNPPKIRVAKNLRPSVDHLVLLVHGAGEYKKDVIEDQSTSRPRVVHRGYEESEIEDPEPSSIDHLLLLCHGVGSACDMRFRSVEEVVEDFRATSLQLLQSHYRNSYDNGLVSRVEVLPISWHAQLHVGEGGVDKRLNRVTLDSIPRLRAFTNHTVLDALFYTSPVYHQTIIETVCYELNRIYSLFKQRNPAFKGGVSLGGHSLGSVILYDLLCHQTPETPLQLHSSAHKCYMTGSTQPLAKYPQLRFPPAALYALGSPIAIFECIRGVEALGMDFALPTCKNFFNIFHPYDPIAYRIEPLINPLLQDVKPFLIPHHKGRKRMHLELKDTMVRVGTDLKQKLIESLRTTWNKWKANPPPEGQLEKVVEEEMEKEQLCDEEKEEVMNAELSGPEMLGKLNDGRRIDYVLQEAPLEMINEYLFAMSSHVGYWESEDTMLLMLREIYSSLGVQPDCSLPQHSMTVTRSARLEDATVINENEYPSTSKGRK